MNKKIDIRELAEYYDNTDTSDLMADAVLETDIVPLPHRHASTRKKASKKAGQAAAKATLRKA